MTINNIIETIKTPEVREIVVAVLAAAPAYFFEIPASTSGKYHPAFSLGNGGLVRHSIVVAHFAGRIALAQGMSQKDIDELIACGLIHDVLKAGYNEEGLPTEQLHTVHEHPVLAAGLVISLFPESNVAWEMADIIKSHMGQWTVDRHGSPVVLPTPETAKQRALSAADMIAATKELSMADGFFGEEE